VGEAYQRGIILYGQKRYAMAVVEFGKELSQNPESALAMSMLALSMNYDRPGTAAIESAHAAIALDPNHAFCHYALASVIIGPSRTFNGFGLGIYLYRHRLRKARRPALRAVQLDPLEPIFFQLLAAIELDLRHPRRALSWADKGLHVRPDHIGCANVRAKALSRLGRPAEAKATVARSLALDPENADTHKTGGLTRLQAGHPEQAISHFVESVRLNPQDQGAVLGLRAARHRVRGRRVALVTIVIVLFISLFRQWFDSDRDTPAPPGSDSPILKFALPPVHQRYPMTPSPTSATIDRPAVQSRNLPADGSVSNRGG
jgi:tetratricopeptide (TPR) repeat protein